VIYDNFKSEFDKLAAGTISLAINIPGTAYHSGMQVHYGRLNLILSPIVFPRLQQN